MAVHLAFRYVDPGEDLAEAAVREVQEETGVATEFRQVELKRTTLPSTLLFLPRSIIAFRHGHKFNFGCSDIYIVVALRPLSSEIKVDQRELAKCEWMPLKEYATHPLVHATNRHFAEKYQECSRTGAFIGLTEIKLEVKNFVRQQAIYSLQQGPTGGASDGD
jgi:8-oxo-dGTP pyrophosphatase MutT (NUDIX family)